MLASPGNSPRHFMQSPSPSIRRLDADLDHAIDRALVLASTPGRSLMGAPPLPKRSKRSQIVVNEDAYVAAIEHIIERDFYPDLPKLRNRLEWLEAVRSGDPVVIREAQLNIIHRMKGKRKAAEKDATPAFPGSSFATPGSVMSGAPSPAPSFASLSDVSISQIPLPDSSNEGPELDTSLSLDDFMRCHTSEDNASFSKIIEKVNKQKREKYRFLSETELPVLGLTSSSGCEKRITDGYGTSGQPESTLETWSYQAKNLLMYDSANREDAPLTKSEKEERIQGPPKVINMQNTRFHGEMFDSKLREDDPVSILYTLVQGATPNWAFAERNTEKGRKRYDLEELRRTPQVSDSSEVGKGDAKPPLNGTAGYSFVATPSPAPGLNESPFMTWGEIEGTPLRLETEDTPVGIGGSGDGPHFKIPAPPTRDARARTLSRDVARSLREKSRIYQVLASPSPARDSMSPGFVGTLSAAAQRFVSKAMAKSCAAVDPKLRASYGASTTPGTPRMARNAVRSREGSRSWREGSMLTRSPSVREGSIPLCSPSASPLRV